MREYIITVKDPAVWDTGLWNELTTDGLGDNFIPQRSLEVLNERPANDYCAHFNLTDEEAALIRQDNRIMDVTPPLNQIKGITIGHCSYRTANYNRSTTSTTADMKNWGLLRSISRTNNFQANLNVNGNFNYNLSGAGVDIIIADSGVWPNHPEFAVNADGSGGSRVVNKNWNEVTGTGIPSNILTSISVPGDYEGHGSNCASIAAGNTCGWAAGATIYSIRLALGEGPFFDAMTGAPLTCLDSTYVFDLVKNFHQQKGNSRPTICTNSWGAGTDFTNMQYTIWRGTQYNISIPDPSLGQVGIVGPITRSAAYTSIEACSAAGVILVGAAGNDAYKADTPVGIDYNNIWNDGTYNWAYHQGMFPTAAPSMICVGAVNSMQTGTIEQKANFSNTGPRVDVYVPGVAIMGAYANVAYYTPAVQDSRNNTYYLNKISGTSQACPQVTGLLACVLQARPTMTPAEAKKFIIENSTAGILNENVAGGTGYTNFYYLQGGANRYLYQPFNSPIRGTITS